MIKKIILISILIVIGLQGFSQQDSQYSLYMFNPIAVNPGYAGSRELLSGVLIHRSQWVGLDGAPTTQAFSLNAPLRNKKIGLGLQIVNDKIGPKNTQTLKGTFAYRLKLGNGNLAFGLSGGVVNYNYDWGQIEYKNQNDVVPTTSAEGFIIPTFDFGVYYNTKTFYIGGSIEHINQANFGLTEVEAVSTSSLLNSGVSGATAKKYANSMMTVGKAFILNDNLVLKTSALFRISNSTGNLDVNAGVLIKNKVLFGTSLRQHGSLTIVLLTEINLSKSLRFGLAYDYDRSDVATSTTGSFELFLGYDLSIFKSKMVSPRYF